jgi:ectoine hydroxylase-related dioxygenase (phytanoyl-CoA dioxygenase family)
MEEHDPGFSIEADVLEPLEVSRIAEALDGVKLRSRAGARHLMSQPVIGSLANDVRLLALARHVIGATARPYRATLFAKSPSANWLVVWHQDTALPLRLRRETPGWGPWSVKAGVLYAHAPGEALERIVALRVHLDDSLPENGPLRVLPGSHRGGVLSDEAIQGLASRVEPRECVVRRGGIMMMRPLLVHASSKAVSNAPRRVLHIEYSASFTLASELELDVA